MPGAAQSDRRSLGTNSIFPQRGRSNAFARRRRGYAPHDPVKGDPNMSLIDKITGRAKKAAGDVADDPSLRREGRKEERKGEAKDDLARAQDRADDKADEVADLERRT
jgi:uncharacterized protein YjbJ (UPF0337 family)